MAQLKFNAARCDLCGICVEKCPFGALSRGEKGIEVNEKCRMCSVCVRSCPAKAISIEQNAGTVDKKEWKDFLIYVEQEHGDIHPVAYELIGEARKMAEKVGFSVNCVLVGGAGTERSAQKLLPYGVDRVYVYEDEAFEGFRADSYTSAVADCINRTKPSSVLIGGTSLGRSLAPRLSTRFHTGLTADCTTLDIMENTDMLQIRPAFGGNIMAQILITKTRPQFATVRYRVLDRAHKTDHPQGQVVRCSVTEEMKASGISVLTRTIIEKKEAIEEAEIIVAAGRGASSGDGVELCRALAEALGGTLCFTRPMVESGFGDQLHQIGLSGHTVRPRFIITCGVSGAIQFTAGMNGADTIAAINTDPNAQIFQTATYCIVDDLYAVIPKLIRQLKSREEE